MKIPPIDLSKFLHLLKSEGRAEMSIASAPKFGELTRGIKPDNLALFKEWDNIILIMEKEVIPLLSKGCEAKSLVGPAQKLAKSAGALSLIATEVLSFVPGPVGIVCSLINAIVCFSTGNIVGGLFELLGCIPGGKIAGKGASKLFPKIEKILIEIVQSNHQLCVIVETASKQQKVVVQFFEKYAPKTKPKPKAEVGYGYGTRIPSQPQPSVLEGQLSKKFPNPAIEGQKEIGIYTTFPNTYGNMGKSNLWPHLGY